MGGLVLREPFLIVKTVVLSVKCFLTVVVNVTIRSLVGE